MVEIQTVLVVGGGFGGVKTALELSSDKRFKVILLTMEPELRYYPTLYRTATGGKRANSSIPLSRIFEDADVEIILGEASTLDRKLKTITTKNLDVISYDTLVLALGVVTNYFGVPGLDKYSFSIKSQFESARFKAHLHQQIVEDKKPDLNYVIVGAGPSGIELAGTIRPYVERVMQNHTIKPQAVHVDIIEALPRLLPRMPIDTSKAVSKQLKKIGVKVYLNSKVESETSDVLLVNGKPIRSHTVIWTAGVMNHPFFASNGFNINERNKVSTTVYLETSKDIFVIGDNAETPYSGLAQTALHDGKFVANNLIRRCDGKDMLAYKPKKPVTVVVAGDRWAAVIYGKLRIYGWLGWLLREAADLVGFHDIEPWNKASKQWMTEFGLQDECIVCSIANNS